MYVICNYQVLGIYPPSQVQVVHTSLPMAVLYWIDSPEVPEVSRRHHRGPVLRVRVFHYALAKVRVDVECRYTSSAP